MNYLERVVDQLAKDNGIELIPEYKFHPSRKWRFDFADIDNKIAIEVEGGIWVSGRHNRGTGYRNDTIKYNQAAVLGWRILRYCSEDDIAQYFLDDYFALNGYTKATDLE